MFSKPHSDTKKKQFKWRSKSFFDGVKSRVSFEVRRFKDKDVMFDMLI